MSNTTFTIRAFGDEIADDLAEQLAVLNELQIDYLELRSAWGKNVLYMSDTEYRILYHWNPYVNTYALMTNLKRQENIVLAKGTTLRQSV